MRQAASVTATGTPGQAPRARRRRPDPHPWPDRRSTPNGMGHERVHLPCAAALTPALRLVVLSGTAALADSTVSRDNVSVDPVVIALAQLVRDRWANEQRARSDRRARLRVVPSEPA